MYFQIAAIIFSSICLPSAEGGGADRESVESYYSFAVVGCRCCQRRGAGRFGGEKKNLDGFLYPVNLSDLMFFFYKSELSTLQSVGACGHCWCVCIYSSCQNDVSNYILQRLSLSSCLCKNILLLIYSILYIYQMCVHVCRFTCLCTFVCQLLCFRSKMMCAIGSDTCKLQLISNYKRRDLLAIYFAIYAR